MKIDKVSKKRLGKQKKNESLVYQEEKYHFEKFSEK